MSSNDHVLGIDPQGLDALRRAVLGVLLPAPATSGWLLNAAGPHIPLTRPVSPADPDDARVPSGRAASGGPADDGPNPTQDASFSSEDSPEERSRLIALVDLARGGDTEAFGLLYDHYAPQVHRFLYYRTRSATLAEDLTSDTFFRALRSMQSFKWQGKDFGAWLMTIARNLATDHFKSGKARLEMTTEDMSLHDDAREESPEESVLGALTNEMLLEALAGLPVEQRDCLVLRFLQSKSIAETAQALGRTEGAVKQLQLRAVRNLAKRMPEGIR